MSLKITGTCQRILDETSGEGRNGTWRKREFVIETQDNYPKTICFTQWGESIDASSFKEGDVLTVSFDLQSREYNNRWYTDAKAWKVEMGDGAGASAGPSMPGGSSSAPSTGMQNRENRSAPHAPQSAETSFTELDDDLPF
jgi:single-stranded DNA-binding protein